MANAADQDWMSDESSVALAPSPIVAPAPAPATAPATAAQAPQPAPSGNAPSGAITDKIAAARNAGYADADIANYLKQSPTWGPKISAATKAGYSESDIFGHWGLKANGQPRVAQSETPTNERDTGWTGALVSGLGTAIRGPMQTAQALTTGKPTGEAPDIVAAEPISWGDLTSPLTLGKKFLYQFAANAPVMAGGIAGGVLGGGATAETGPGALGGAAIGSAIGATLASAATSLGPDFANELKVTPDDPHGAFNRAMSKTGIGAMFTGASFAAFGAAPFQSTLKNLMFQAFGVQPGIAAAQQATENVVAGKPVTEGIAEGLPGSVLMTAIPGVAHAALSRRNAAKANTAVGENLNKTGGAGDEAKVVDAQAEVAGDVGGKQATDWEGIGRELEAGTRRPTPALDIEGNPLPMEGEGEQPTAPPTQPTAPEAEGEAQGATVPGVAVTTPGEAGNVPAPATAPEPTPTAPLKTLPPYLPYQASTAKGTTIDALPMVTDLSRVIPSNFPDGRINPDYPQELQPRDRTTKKSQSQVQDIISKFRPDWLLPSPMASAGSPIINAAGHVESGNGRMMALTQILTDSRYADKRVAYLQTLKDAGYGIEGIKNPVLVSLRGTELQGDAYKKFLIEANDRDTAEMSDAEKARADATRAAQIMHLWNGESAGAASNRDFARAFLGNLPESEAGALRNEHGGLNQNGIDRLNLAVMAHAYGDEGGVTLNRFLNSDNEGMKGVSNALKDAAGLWSKMRADAEAGHIPASLDITGPLMEAVQTLSEARKQDVSVKSLIDQTSFDRPPVSDEARAILRQFFRNDDMTTMAGRKPVADFLQSYAEKARKQIPSMLEGGVEDRPTKIINDLIGKPEEQAALFSRRGVQEADVRPHPEAVQSVIDAVNRMTGGHFLIEAHDANSDVFTVKFKDENGRPQTEQVSGYVFGSLIRAAIEGDRTAWNFNHETLHAIRKMNVLKPGEWKTLEAAAKKNGWADEFKISERYPGMSEAGVTEEAIAEKFAQWQAGEKKPTALLDRMGAKIKNFLDRVRNLLTGNGFRTADDVFGGIKSGEIGARSLGRVLPTVERSVRNAPGGEEAQFQRREKEEPAKLSPEAQKANRSYATPGGQSALQFPVKERSVIGKIADSIEKVFSPTSRGPLAEQMQYALRRHGAELSNARERLHVLDDADHIMGRLPVDEQLEFTHRAETGQKQPTAELEGVAQGLRKALDEWTGKIQTLGRGIGKELLKDAKEFYMGRIYANHAEWTRGEAPGTPTELREQLRKSWAEAQSNKSLTGSANFLKQRTFNTLKEAMDAGLVPVTTNPVRMQVLKLMEMQRFYYGTKIAEQLKQSHMARWVPYHLEQKAKNNGWVKLDDKVFQPKIVHEGNYGVTNVGGWYAPEEAATVFNNYMSKSLVADMPVIDAVRATGNALNLIQLGLSGFHFTFVLGDTMASMTALGIKQMAEGLTSMNPVQMARGLKNVAFGATPGLNVFTAVIPTLRRGAQLREWLHMDYNLLPPKGKKAVDAFLTAGSREKMGSFHNAEQQGAFIHNMKDLGRLLTNPGDFGREIKEMFQDHPYTGVFHLIGRLIQNVTEPLMGTMVPLAKLGAFRNMAENFERMHPDATAEQRQKALTEAWDAVDDRLGQMVYDNVFWNKTLKDFAFMSTRSVGWNLGSLRILGGAPLDTARAVSAALKGQRPEVTQRMSYAMALPLVVAPVGAMLTYLMTGQGPQSMLDYFFPPDGKGGRFSLPSYIKDAFEYAHDPFQTLKNKTHPLLSGGLQMLNNTDYYGHPIAARGENPVVSYADFLLGQAIPFSFRGQQKMASKGASAGEQVASFWGIQPAPGYISDPEREARYKNREAKMKSKAEAKGTVPDSIKRLLASP